MDATGRNAFWLILAATVGLSGCFCQGMYTKSMNERCCPTDVRKTHFWCFGEDSLIHGPCGPKEYMYGYEQNCWREWPTCSVSIDGNFTVPPGPIEDLPPAFAPQSSLPRRGKYYQSLNHSQNTGTKRMATKASKMTSTATSAEFGDSANPFRGSNAVVTPSPALRMPNLSADATQ